MPIFCGRDAIVSEVNGEWKKECAQNKVVDRDCVVELGGVVF